MVRIKKVVGVSIGPSSRDHTLEIELGGEMFTISRVGTDGSIERAAQILGELDGKVDAFGMGGIDMYLKAAGRRYYFRDAKKLKAAAGNTPIVDGSGLKGAVEAGVVRHLIDECGLEFKGKKALVTSAVDRWGMAQALRDAGCE
ncbi:MAG: quinate 5-dehydrogenase, partial [Actinobacteria bacterium]|nr:quinate 5-dehydrogenase [Actinomycetota bacterium]